LRQRRETLQPEVLAVDLGAALVGADVAGQHQHIGARGWLGHELGVDFEVQVGQQLDLHVASLVNHGE
jgi:hypothetical protein